MLAMLLVLLIAVGNFALGFYLAVHLGHGPAGCQLPTLDKIRNRLRSLLRLGGKQASEPAVHS
jgi:nitrogenase molybdenum-iron protein alpha/beta subunit